MKSLIKTINDLNRKLKDSMRSNHDNDELFPIREQTETVLSDEQP